MLGKKIPTAKRPEDKLIDHRFGNKKQVSDLFQLAGKGLSPGDWKGNISSPARLCSNVERDTSGWVIQLRLLENILKRGEKRTKPQSMIMKRDSDRARKESRETPL